MKLDQENQVNRKNKIFTTTEHSKCMSMPLRSLETSFFMKCHIAVQNVMRDAHKKNLQRHTFVYCNHTLAGSASLDLIATNLGSSRWYPDWLATTKMYFYWLTFESPPTR